MPEANVDPSAQPLNNAINATTGAPDSGVPINEPTPTPQPDPDPVPNDTPAPAPTGDTPAVTAEGDGTKKTPWFQRRIDQLTAEKWEERRTVDQLRKQTTDLLAQLAEARKGGAVSIPAPQNAPATPPANTPPTSATQGMSDAELNALADRMAEEKARVKAFNRACDDVAERGKDEFDDFDKKLRTFQMLGGLPTPLLETITEMPNAHKVLYHLGSDPDLAERVVKMSPVRQAMELARIEGGISKPAPRPVSQAPAPVQPIDTGGRATDDPEKMSMADFVIWREKQLVAKKKK